MPRRGRLRSDRRGVVQVVKTTPLQVTWLLASKAEGCDHCRMPYVIAYAWLATAIVTIALAARRRIPIINAFGWIDSRPGLNSSLAVVAVVSGLAVLQLASNAQLLGARANRLGVAHRSGVRFGLHCLPARQVIPPRTSSVAIDGSGTVTTANRSVLSITPETRPEFGPMADKVTSTPV